MDAILETLRTSTDNATRRAASAALRQSQQTDPCAFFEWAWAGVSSPALSPRSRFFLAAAVADFAGHSRQTDFSRERQAAAVAQHAELLAGGALPSAALARKVAEALSRLACRRWPNSEKLSPAEEAATHLAAGAMRASAAGCADDAAQCLLALHVFLKETQTRVVSGLFQRLCPMLVPFMSELFAASAAWRVTGGWYMPLLYLYKCALRVFGFGVFEVSFYPFLLRTTWQIAQETVQHHQQSEEQHQAQRLRLLEYALKVQERAVYNFSSRLHALSLSFFTLTPDAANYEADASLFALLDAVIFGVFSPLATEKLVCRAMRIYLHIFANEESDPFASACVMSFFRRPDALRLLTRRLIELLADRTDAASLALWDSDPERYAEELDAADDEDENGPSVSCGAEQLLLALTGSSGGAPAALAAAWEAVHNALRCGGSDPAAATAALHAIGVCCYTMSASPGYGDFLEAHLLPMMAAPPDAVSPFVRRRVVWLVGMWCEALSNPADRMRVHDALAGLIASNSTQTVVRLVALRSVAHFIADGAFTQAELDARHLHAVLGALRDVMPALRTPGAVRELAALAYAMAERGLFALVGVGVGDALLDVFLPAAQRLIARAQPRSRASLRAPLPAESPGAHEGNTQAEPHDKKKDEEEKYEEEDGEDEDDGAELDAGALGGLIECLGSCARDAPPDRAWRLFAAVVVPCAAAGAPLAAWAADEAWALLLSLARAARAWRPPLDAALVFALAAASRDFSALPLAMRAAAALALIAPPPLSLESFDSREAFESFESLGFGEFAGGGAVARATEAMASAQAAELRESCFALLAVHTRRAEANARGQMIACAVARLLAMEDVQADACGVSFALLLAVALPPFAAEAEGGAQALTGAVRGHARGDSFAERLALLIDVSPSALATRWIVALLRWIAERTPLLSASDISLVGHVMAAAQQREEDDAKEGVRDMCEMMLEMFGDADVPPGSPHISRLAALFGLSSV